MVDGWSTSFHIGPILGPPGRDYLASMEIRLECRVHAIAEAIAVPARTPPFGRCEHVIGAAVGSLLAQAKQATRCARRRGKPSRGRHLFVSDDERVAGLNA
jgi:hypothetical protein